MNSVRTSSTFYPSSFGGAQNPSYAPIGNDDDELGPAMKKRRFERIFNWSFLILIIVVLAFILISAVVFRQFQKSRKQSALELGKNTTNFDRSMLVDDASDDIYGLDESTPDSLDMGSTPTTFMAEQNRLYEGMVREQAEVRNNSAANATVSGLVADNIDAGSTGSGAKYVTLLSDGGNQEHIPQQQLSQQNQSTEQQLQQNAEQQNQQSAPAVKKNRSMGRAFKLSNPFKSSKGNNGVTIEELPSQLPSSNAITDNSATLIPTGGKITGANDGNVVDDNNEFPNTISTDPIVPSIYPNLKRPEIITKPKSGNRYVPTPTKTISDANTFIENNSIAAANNPVPQEIVSKLNNNVLEPKEPTAPVEEPIAAVTAPTPLTTTTANTASAAPKSSRRSGK